MITRNVSIRKRWFISVFFGLGAGLFSPLFLPTAFAQTPLCKITQNQPWEGWVSSNGYDWVKTTFYAPGNTIRAQGEWTCTNNWVNEVDGVWDVKIYRVDENGIKEKIGEYYARVNDLDPLGGWGKKHPLVQANVPWREDSANHYVADVSVYFEWFDPNAGSGGEYVRLTLPLAESAAHSVTFHQPGYTPPGGQ